MLISCGFNSFDDSRYMFVVYCAALFSSYSTMNNRCVSWRFRPSSPAGSSMPAISIMSPAPGRGRSRLNIDCGWLFLLAWCDLSVWNRFISFALRSFHELVLVGSWLTWLAWLVWIYLCRFVLLVFWFVQLYSYFEIVRDCIYVFVYNNCQAKGIRDEEIRWYFSSRARNVSRRKPARMIVPFPFNSIRTQMVRPVSVRRARVTTKSVETDESSDADR